MRALKSLLGTPLLREERRINGQSTDFIRIIAQFLAEIKSRAEAATHQTFTHALSGRPVHFHSSDPGRDAQAEIDLRDCYLAAGFEDVRFLYEPEAAVRSAAPAAGLGLIVDIGGGTSDSHCSSRTAQVAHIFWAHTVCASAAPILTARSASTM